MGKDFEIIRERCERDALLSRQIVDEFLIYYAAEQYGTAKEFDKKVRKYKSLTREFTSEHFGYLKAQYIAYKIFRQQGLIGKIIKHSAMTRFSPEEMQFIQALAAQSWQFSFSIIHDNPSENFYLMEDILSGEEFLLYSKSTTELLDSGPRELWFNLLTDNGDCKVSYGPVSGYKGFLPEDVFFLGAELDPEIEIWQEVQENIDKDPLPYMLMLSKSEIPLTAHKDDLLLYNISEFDAGAFKSELPGEEFRREYSSGVYRYSLKNYEDHPHFAQVYYDEQLHILIFSAMTSRGYEALMEAFCPYAPDLPSEASVVVTLLMLSYASGVSGKKIELNEYEELFHVEPSQEDADFIERINLAISEMLPDINAGRAPDTKNLAEKYDLNKEDLDNMLKEVNKKKNRSS